MLIKTIAKLMKILMALVQQERGVGKRKIIVPVRKGPPKRW